VSACDSPLCRAIFALQSGALLCNSRVIFKREDEFVQTAVVDNREFLDGGAVSRGLRRRRSGTGYQCTICADFSTADRGTAGRGANQSIRT